MKVVNVILSVLILLLAAASAVFSYFLFEKRGQLVGGWDKMATAINQAAVELDRNSGTKVAKELTPEALGHTNYATLDENLRKITKLVKDLTIQRDELADALLRVSSSAELRNINKQGLTGLDTYAAGKLDVMKGVNDAITKRNRTIDQFVNLVRNTLNVNLNARALKDGDTNAMKQLTDALNQIKSRRNAYEAKIRDINSQTGAGAPNFDDKNYNNSLNKTLQAVRDLKGKYQGMVSEVDKAKQNIQNLQRQINERDNKIAMLNKTVGTKDGQLNELKRALGIDMKDTIPAPWKAGSVEARKAIQGKVLEVNDRYGYVCINLGKNSVVPQQIGNKVAEVDPGIAPGLQLVITRGELDKKGSEFIARVTVTDVADDCLLANLPKDGKSVQVGDFVYYEEEPKAEEPKAEEQK